MSLKAGYKASKRRTLASGGFPWRDSTGGNRVHGAHSLTSVVVSGGSLSVNTDTAYCYAGESKSIKVTQSAASTDVDFNVRENLGGGANPLVIPIFPAVTDVKASTTVTTGAASATQTVGSTAHMLAGDSLYFVTAGVTRVIGSITNGTTVVLTASVTTTTGETVNDVTYDDQIRVRMTDSQGFGTAYVDAQMTLVSGVWNVLTINLNQLTATLGTVDLKDIRTIRVTYLLGASTQVFYIGRITCGARFEPWFLWRADDEYLNNLTVLAPILDGYGWPVMLGLTNYFWARSAGFIQNVSQMGQLAGYRFRPVNHSYGHEAYVSVGNSQSYIEGQLTSNTTWARNNGIDYNNLMSRVYIAPYGEINDTVRAALRAQNYVMAWSTKRGKQTTSDNPPFDTQETFAFGDPLTLRIVNPRNGSHKTTAALMADIDQISEVGGISCLMLHSVTSAAAGDSGDDLIRTSGDITADCVQIRHRERTGRLKVIDICDLADVDWSPLTWPSIETLAPASCPGLTGWAVVSTSNTFSDVGSTPASVDGGVLRLGGANSINWDAPAGTGGVLRAITNNGASFHAIEFNSTLGSLVSGTLTMTQPYSIFVVAKVLTLDGTTLNQFFVDGNGASNRAGIYAQGTQDKWAVICGTELYGNGANDTSYATDTSWHVFELHAEGAKSMLFVDGEFICGDANTQNTTTLTLGNRYAAAGSAGTNVQVAAILPSPSLNLRRTGHADHLRAYLMDTFGITPRVPQTGHYVPR